MFRRVICLHRPFATTGSTTSREHASRSCVVWSATKSSAHTGTILQRSGSHAMTQEQWCAHTIGKYTTKERAPALVSNQEAQRTDQAAEPESCAERKKQRGSSSSPLGRRESSSSPRSMSAEGRESSRIKKSCIAFAARGGEIRCYGSNKRRRWICGRE